MTARDAFRLNGSQIIYENIDGELVLINMSKGSYYSTDAVGAQLWELIIAGCRVEEMQEHIHSRYEGEAAEIVRGIGDFLAELQREELIVRDENPQGDGHPRPAAASARTPFRPPVLNKYRDMEDMLTLDPIHEVEEAGWPAPKPAEFPPPPAPRTAE
jgi:hypothetical protein